jgi:hypothetical protein
MSASLIGRMRTHLIHRPARDIIPPLGPGLEDETLLLPILYSYVNFTTNGSLVREWRRTQRHTKTITLRYLPILPLVDCVLYVFNTRRVDGSFRVELSRTAKSDKRWT